MELTAKDAADLRSLTEHIPRQCVCGCGAPINERLIAIIELRKLGYKQTAIAERLGCSVAMVKTSPRQIARYRKGHTGHQPAGILVRPCTRCGRPVNHRVSSLRDPHCRIPCLPMQDWIRMNCADYDARIERRKEAARNGSALILGPLRAISASRRRTLRRARIEGWASVLGETSASPAELVTENEELQALLREQSADERRSQIQHAPSLDALTEDDDDGSFRSASLGAVHFDRDDDQWAYRAAQGTRRRVRASR